MVKRDIIIIICLAVFAFYILYRMKKNVDIAYLADESNALDDQEAANVQAFLATIRFAEGTLGYDGYRTLYSYKYFDDFSKHPNRKICANNICSTAAGAYQILYNTWITVIQPRAALPDFSPESQDKAAVVLLDKRNALADVKAGRFADAIAKVNKEWASLPGSPYGQPTKTLAQVQNYYTAQGGVVV